MFELRANEKDRQKIGIFFDLDSPLAMECIALSGFDFAIVDLEHSPLAVQNTVELICRGQLRGMNVLVRTEDASRAAILKPLDAGADGIVVPGIGSLDQAKQTIAYGKYPPLGARGVSLTRAAAYGYDPEIDRLPKLFELKNRQAKLILQCEKVGCLEEIEQIAALDGVDGILIGPYDLSTDMGLAGEFGHKQVRAAFQRIKDACRAVGKPVMIFSKTVRDAKARLEEGYDAVAVATVSAVLVDGCRRLLNEANGLAIP